MPRDLISPIAPAFICTLLLPVGRIRKKRFYDFVARIQKENIIRLGDISADAHNDLATFSPKAFPSGCLLYDFTLVPPPANHASFSPFEAFREPLLVICIADGKEYVGQDVGQQHLENQLDLARAAYPRVALLQLFVFDIDGDQMHYGLPNSSIVIPPRASSKLTTIKTIMCDVSARFLAGLSTKASSIQESKSMETPHQPPGDSKDTQLPLGPFLASTPRKSLQEKLVRPASPADSELSVHSEGTVDDSPARIAQQNANDISKSDRMASSERAKIKLKMRQRLALGGLYLQAGRWSDALRELVDNTNRARAFADHRWYAKGLENTLVAMLLLAWNGMEFPIPQICYASSEKPHSTKNSLPTAAIIPKTSNDSDNAKIYADVCSIIPGMLDMINSAHSRASDAKSDSFPLILFSDSIIRLSCLFTLMHRNGGLLNRSLMDLFVMGSPSNPALGPKIKPNANFHTNKKVSDFLFLCYPSDTDASDSGLLDKVTVLAKISTVLALAGLRRKQAMVTRDILAILSARPNLLSSSQYLSGLKFGLSDSSERMHSFHEVKPLTHVVEELLSLLFTTYGMSQTAGSLRGTIEDHSSRDKSDEASDSADNIDSTYRNNSWDSFGNYNLKQVIYRLAADISSLLGNPSKAVAFLASGLGSLDQTKSSVPRDDAKWQQTFASVPALPQDAQLEFMGILQRYLDDVPPEKLNDGIAYWDKHVLRNIELQNLPPDRCLIRSRLSSFLAKTGQEGAMSAFQLRPRNQNQSLPEPDEPLMVAAESSEFLLTFQNPFAFDSFVEHLSFITSGPTLDLDVKPFTLKANALSRLFLRATPAESGVLKIQGCRMKFRDCREEAFFIFPPGWLSNKDDKIKQVGLDAIPVHPAMEMQNKPQPIAKAFTILPSQPRLEVIETPCQPLNLQLCAGEKSVLSFKVLNISESTTCDFFFVTFQNQETDSSSVSSSMLPFKWIHPLKEPLKILPGQTFDVKVEVTGVRTLTTATVVIDYANLEGAPTGRQNDRIYTRKLQIPMKMTILEAVHAVSMDLIPSQPHSTGFQEDTDKSTKVMLLVDFKNDSQRPLLVLLHPKHSKGNVDELESENLHSSLSVSTLTQSGQTGRVALPLPRSPGLAQPEGLAASPSSTGSLQSLVHAFWKDPSSSVYGTIDLSQLKFSPQIAALLKGEDVSVDIIVANSSDDAVEASSQKYSANDFLKLTITITNNTSKDLDSWVQIEPACSIQSSLQASNTATFIAWTGPLEQNVILRAHASERIVAGASFVAAGQFEIGVKVYHAIKELTQSEQSNEPPRQDGLPLKTNRLIASSVRTFNVVEA